MTSNWPRSRTTPRLLGWCGLPTVLIFFFWLRVIFWGTVPDYSMRSIIYLSPFPIPVFDFWVLFLFLLHGWLGGAGIGQPLVRHGWRVNCGGGIGWRVNLLMWVALVDASTYWCGWHWLMRQLISMSVVVDASTYLYERSGWRVNFFGWFLVDGST